MKEERRRDSQTREEFVARERELTQEEISILVALAKAIFRRLMRMEKMNPIVEFILPFLGGGMDGRDLTEELMREVREEERAQSPGGTRGCGVSGNLTARERNYCNHFVDVIISRLDRRDGVENITHYITESLSRVGGEDNQGVVGLVELLEEIR